MKSVTLSTGPWPTYRMTMSRKPELRTPLEPSYCLLGVVLGWQDVALTRCTCLWAAGGYTSFPHPIPSAPSKAMTRRSEPSIISSPYNPSPWHRQLLHESFQWISDTFTPCHAGGDIWANHSNATPWWQNGIFATVLNHLLLCCITATSASHLSDSSVRLSPLQNLLAFSLALLTWALVSELGKGLPHKGSFKMGTCSAMLALQFLRSPLIHGIWGCREPRHLSDQILAKWVGIMVLFETVLWNSRLTSPAGTTTAWLWLQPLEHSHES